MNVLEVASVPIIATLVYFLLSVYKIIVDGKGEKYMKIIPILAGCLGIVFALIAYFFIPNIIYADNIYLAILFGIYSGLSATGVNQIYKQLTK